MRLLRVRAAWHEISCWECRVSWRSWLKRLTIGQRVRCNHCGADIRTPGCARTADGDATHVYGPSGAYWAGSP